MITISSRAFRDMCRGQRSGIIDVDGFFFLLRVEYVWFALVSCGGAAVLSRSYTTCREKNWAG